MSKEKSKRLGEGGLFYTKGHARKQEAGQHPIRVTHKTNKGIVLLYNSD